MSADSTGSRPAVQAAEPPAALIKIGNVVIGTLLRSPAHGAVDKAFLLLHVTGRKTGKQYDIVLGRHEVGGALFVVTSAPWSVSRSSRHGDPPSIVLPPSVRRVCGSMRRGTCLSSSSIITCGPISNHRMPWHWPKAVRGS